ncbi:phosphoadenosine phosphosulfate reductase family protein [Clostridium sp. HBUAS56010]|uniref:phosphoadenosine phosphosulfate reductase family protein n=1 Tax=Clostridium sp. HBUAS56010 TaxID=2571127 RepID=UPI001FAAA9A7|nr:phosphoadenosine phosphosulfate reductase family protein [Clostridium sp. HBUAS56010]
MTLSINEVLDTLPQDEIIVNNFIKAWKIINNPDYEKIVCSISGGSDSDDMLDICYRCDIDKKIDYVWFNTGLEYEATKEHLKHLEEKYDIKIREIKAVKPIPVSCKEYGQPFLSKQVSEFIGRLQKYGFKWEDKDLDKLLVEYCVEIPEAEAVVNGKVKKGIARRNNRYWKGCVSALEWWCNSKKSKKLCIAQNKWLKDFLIENPPIDTPISNKCCIGAKKAVIHNLLKEGIYGLSIVGIRKAEGGARATAYKNCFDENDDSCDNYRPLFFYKNDTKMIYENHFDICHSDCYTKYGLKRTGCAGCPFGRDFEFELEVIQKYEPKLYAAVNYIFGKSYEYTRKYREFTKMKNDEIKKLKTGNKD